MIEYDELLEIRNKIFEMMDLREEKKKRFQELENNDLVKEYFSLIEENKELDKKIKKMTRDYTLKKMGRCTHDTLIYNGSNIITYYDDFLLLRFICSRCKCEFEYTTGIYCGQIDLDYSKEESLFNLIKNHNIKSPYANTREETMNFFKKYINIATFDSFKNAEEYALTRKRKLDK